MIYVKKIKLKPCSIVNVVESSIARTSDFVLPIHAGPEIGVASTKAFIGQMLVLYILAIKMSEVRKEISKIDYVKKISELKKLPLIEKTCFKMSGSSSSYCERFFDRQKEQCF